MRDRLSLAITANCGHPYPVMTLSAGDGTTLVADGERITATLAGQHPAALRALAAPQAAFFGAAGDYRGSVCESAGPGRMSIRLRLDDLAWFSAEAATAIPVLRAAIAQHLERFRLGPGQGVLLSNTRWLHGRDGYRGRRAMLRILGDPLPGTAVVPGFPSPSLTPNAKASRAA